MSPQNNSSDELSVYADWLEENGCSVRSAELREDVLNEEPTKSHWAFMPIISDGWVNACDSGDVGVNIHDNGATGFSYAHHVGTRNFASSNVGSNIDGVGEVADRVGVGVIWRW